MTIPPITNRFRSRLRRAVIRSWLVHAAVAGLAVAGPVGRAAAQSTAPARPNVLLIVVDDLNDWVGPLGGHPGAVTPNIDRLAARGLTFTNAHAAAPLCGPTRAAMLSGLRPSTTGIYGHNDLSVLRRNRAVSQTVLLPLYFKQHGYATFSTGKVFHEGSPAVAFDAVGVAKTDYGPKPAARVHYTPPPGTERTQTDWGPFPDRDDDMPDARSARWAADRLRERHDRPFLLCVGFVRPHVPWHVPREWFDAHPLPNIVLPVTTENDLADVPETARRFATLPAMPTRDWMERDRRWEQSVQAYLACTTFTDHQVGRVLDALEAGPHARDTVVVLVGDNGYHVGEKGIWAKHTLWERSTRVPLIIARPGGAGGGGRTARPVNQVDLYPTLLDLAGLPPNARNEGRSLVPLLADPAAAGYDASVSTHGWGNHAVRTDRWRYIRYADGAEELYDHAADPNEWTNLATRPESATVVASLRKHLPSTEAPWVAGTNAGSDYNEYLADLYAKHRDDR